MAIPRSKTVAVDKEPRKSRVSFNSTESESNDKIRTYCASLGDRCVCTQSCSNCNAQTSQARIIHEQVDLLRKEKHLLKLNLQEALNKQHEAMQKAITLAERNERLENEIKEIDKLAIDVEKQCNTTVKNKSEKLVKLEELLREGLSEISKLEKTNGVLAKEKRHLLEEMNILRAEKMSLQTALDSDEEERKKMTQKISNFSMIENDLNLEIDRLVRETSQLRQKIMELEASNINNRITTVSQVKHCT